MKTVKYRVLRDHIGPNGELFSPKGDMSVREATPREVAHLVPLTLELIEVAPETATENKAEVAPETAAEPAPARKGK